MASKSRKGGKQICQLPHPSEKCIHCPFVSGLHWSLKALKLCIKSFGSII